jgi:hypothetical protein
MNAMFSGIVGDDGKRKGAITEFLSPFLSESIGTERITDVAFLMEEQVRLLDLEKTVYYRKDEPV